MTPKLEPTAALLARTPAALAALLRGQPEVATRRNEGVGTWSAFDVVGHLVHGERTDWMPRAKIILEQGESRTFDRYDRWAQRRESRGKTLAKLLNEFAALRAANLAELRRWRLRPADLARRGRHPALGSVTLAQLLAAWAVHDLTHLHQLSRSWRIPTARRWALGRCTWACSNARATARRRSRRPARGPAPGGRAAGRASRCGKIEFP